MATKTRSSAADGDDFALRERASRLGLWGLLEHWSEVAGEPWLLQLLELEEKTRTQRSLERRVREARLGQFKPLADFDWQWPEEIDRELVDDLLSLDFLADGTNVVVVGPQGVGKTMIAKNLAHLAVLRGHTVLSTTASQLLNDLAAQETGTALMRRLRRYSQPQLLFIDELGYLSTSSEHADLLFELVNRRYEEKSIVLTTNRAFKEWNEVFPSSSCLVALIDRLVHRAEILKIAGESYRAKEAQERARQREEERKRRRAQKTKPK